MIAKEMVDNNLDRDQNDLEFDKSLNNLGRATSIIALLFMFLVPIGTMIYFKINIDIKDAFKASSGLIAIFLPMAVIENISYYPILGAGGIYLGSITGNVLNMKLPSAIAGLKIAQVEPGSREGDVISILCVGVSSIVTTIIVFAGLFIGKSLLPILNSAVLKPGFANIVPALLGAVTIPNLLSNKKNAIAPVIFALIAFFLIGPSSFPKLQSYALIVVMSLSVLVSYFIYKSGRK